MAIRNNCCYCSAYGNEPCASEYGKEKGFCSQRDNHVTREIDTKQQQSDRLFAALSSTNLIPRD